MVEYYPGQPSIDLNGDPTTSPQNDGGEKGRRRHRVRWGTVLFLGIALIVVANVFLNPGDQPDGRQWVTAVATAAVLALLMVVYGVAERGNPHVSPDTKGDGFYYLGLLFTFASLVPALIALARAPGTDDPFGDMLPLIGNFGIALVTTIVGLSGRVLFTMAQDSPGDVTTHATHALEAAINDMTDIVVRGGRSMEDLVGHLKRSADELQKTTEGIASSVEKADSTATALDAYSTKVAKMAGALSSSVDDFRDVVARSCESVRQLEKRTESTDKSLRSLVDAIEGASKMLLTVGVATEEAKAGLLEARDGAVREIAGVTAQVSALGNEVVGTREEFKKMAGVFADGAKEATRTLNSVESSASKAAALEEGLDKTGAAVSALAANVDEAGTSMADATLNFRTASGRAAAAGEGLEGMKDAATQVQSDLATVSQVARGMQDQLTGPGSEATKQMTAAATEAGKVASDLNRLTDQLSATQEELYGITKQSATITDKLAEHTGARRRTGLFGWLLWWRR